MKSIAIGPLRFEVRCPRGMGGRFGDFLKEICWGVGEREEKSEASGGEVQFC